MDAILDPKTFGLTARTRKPLVMRKSAMVMVMVAIYTPHFLYAYSNVVYIISVTCLKGEVGHQHICIGAADSRYQSISDLTQPMNHEIAQRPDQHTGNSTPYSLRLVCGFFNVPQGYEH